VTVVSPVKTAEPIEMSLRLWARMRPRNHALDGGQDPCVGMGNFEGKRAAHCKVQDALPSAVQK